MAGAQKKRIGDVHCGKQTNYGTAADDSEVLYVVSLSSRVDHLPSELRKCVKASVNLSTATGTVGRNQTGQRGQSKHLFQKVGLHLGHVGSWTGHIFDSEAPKRTILRLFNSQWHIYAAGASPRRRPRMLIAQSHSQGNFPQRLDSSFSCSFETP